MHSINAASITENDNLDFPCGYLGNQAVAMCGKGNTEEIADSTTAEDQQNTEEETEDTTAAAVVCMDVLWV